MSAQLPRCRHAVNPAHVCTEACSAAIAEQEALYGPPHRDAAYGRWTAQRAVKLPSTALAVARVMQVGGERVEALSRGVPSVSRSLFSRCCSHGSLRSWRRSQVAKGVCQSC